MERAYDVIIAGAGPAGSAAAAIFGEKGRRVLLLDRGTFPREKTCGDGMTFKCIEPLTRLGVADEFLAKAKFGARGYSLWFSDVTELTVRRPMVGDHSFVYILQRYEFDALVLGAALRQPTVTLQAETRLTGLERDHSGRIVGLIGDHRGTTQSYRAPLIIDACGANSPLAVLASAGNRDPAKCALALRGYYDNIDDLGDTVEFYFDESLQPGYFWIFPTGPRSANIGLGTFQHIIEDKKLDLRQLMTDFFERHPVARKKLRNAVLCGSLMGGKIPLAIDYTSSRVRDNFIMVGDAASFTDPITAEGISYAMKSGIFAAEVGAEALEAGDCSAGALVKYDELWRAGFGKQFRRAPILTNLVPKEVFIGSLQRSFVESPSAQLAIGDLQRQYELMFKLKALMKAL